MARGRLILTLLTLPALALGACSDEEGGLSEEEQEYVDAFAVALASDDGMGVEADEARCMAEAVMDELGVEPFDDAGVAPSDIQPGAGSSSPGELLGDGAVSVEQAESIIEVWGDDCVDLTAVMVESAGSDFDLDPEGKECFADGLGDADLSTRLLVASFTTSDGTPDEATMTDLLQVMDDCAGASGSPVVNAIAESLAAQGTITDEQAQCLAQGVVDDLGIERMSELFAEGDFDDLDEDAQNEVAVALLDAARTCGVAAADLGG